jgi:hypothetical protein
MPRRRIQFSTLAYWAALAALFTWAAWLRMQAPLDPIADPDVWGYLAPAVNKLLGNGFTHSGRNFTYPGFVYLLLRVAGDFRVIVFVQHALGLLAGVLLLLIWHRLRHLIGGASLPAAAHRWLGLLPVALYLFPADPIRFELQIRPEAVCGFLGMLNFYMVLQFTYWFFIREERRAAVLYSLGTILSGLVLGSVRPSFWLAALGSMLPVGFVFLRRGWSREKLAIALGAIATLALVLLPERILARNDEMARAFVPTHLFFEHADIIRDQMANDLAARTPLPYPRELVERTHSALVREISKSSEAAPGRYSSLGFDPEYLLFKKGSSHSQLSGEFSQNIDELSRFHWFWYGRAVLKQPARMLAKIGHQILLFYEPRCRAYNLSRFLDLQNDYASSAKAIGDENFWVLFGAYVPAVDFVKRSTELAQGPIRLEQRSYIQRPLRALARTYVPCLFAAVILSAIIWARAGLRRRWGWLAGLVLFAYWYSFATCFLTAAINSLEVPRFTTVLFIFALLAQSLTVVLLLEWVTALLRYCWASGAAGPSRPPHPESN